MPPTAGTARTLRVAGELTAAGPSRWTGAVTSAALGRGRLALTREVRFRTFVTGMLLRLAARFPSGELRGCVDVSITPSGGSFRWSGPGVILTAPPALSRYRGLSLRFAGVTEGGRPRRMSAVAWSPTCHPGFRVTTTRASSALALAAATLSLLAVGCGDAPSGAARLDGIYRLTTSADELARIDAPGEDAENWGTWTLVLDRGRFAFTREGAQACTWAYGALGLEKGNVMDWTVIDGGGARPAATANQPHDSYRFRWSRYRDVLTLSALQGRSSGYFAAKPWRRVAATPSAQELSRRCPPPAGALEPTGAERACRITVTGQGARAVGRPRQDAGPATWVGRVASKQLGPGRLAIDGDVELSRSAPRTRLTFTARFSEGELRGCAILAVLRRPHGRYLWQSSGGQITGTSPGLREYLGLPVGIRGVTTAAHLDRVSAHVESVPAAQREAGAPSRDLC